MAQRPLTGATVEASLASGTTGAEGAGAERAGAERTAGGGGARGARGMAATEATSDMSAAHVLRVAPSTMTPLP